MSLHTEIHFETELCAALAARGWLCAEKDHERFDRASGLFLPDRRPPAFSSGAI
jgi:type I restriction enzyme R subunit